MEAITLIKALPSNKTELDNYVNLVKQQILSGSENPLKIAIQLKAMGEIISSLTKDADIKSLILDEAEKYPEKSFDDYGARFEKKEVGVKYDYSNDGKWVKINNEIKVLSILRKDREDLLKTIKSENVADSESGEILNPPIKKSSGVQVIVKLK